MKGLVEGGLFEKKKKLVEEQGEGKKEFSVEEKVKILVMERLRMNEEIVHRWQDVSSSPSFSALPHVILSLKIRKST